MANTKYIITSKKIIAVALAFVMLAVMLVGCTKDEPVSNDANKTSTEATLSQSGEGSTDGSTIADNDNIAESDNQTETDESTSDEESSTVKNDAEKNNTSKNNSSETTTKKNTSSGGKETTTKKNSSSGSTNKTTTTTKPAVTTTVATCKHNWKIDSYVNGCYVYYCSKCDNYKSEEREMNPDDFMGSKSEYLELLGYINEARREAGLNELVYVDDFQKGANTRAQELTVSFSHTRPDGSFDSTAYSYSSLIKNVYGKRAENIVSGASTAKQAFDAWMNSSGHRNAILDEEAIAFVASRCNRYWMMATFYDYTPYL